MAAPPGCTIKNLNGKWQMNKELSDDFDPVLALQGMSWMMRTAIGMATVTQHIMHYTDDTGKTRIDIEQTVLGGIQASPEKRTLDWTERSHSDRIFGELLGKSRYIAPAELPEAEVGGDKDWLCEGWDEEGVKVESWVENKNAEWTAIQIWGFGLVDGARYWIRRVVVQKGAEKIRARLVYNYAGELDKE